MRRRAMETAGTLTSLVPIRNVPNPLNLPALRRDTFPLPCNPQHLHLPVLHQQRIPAAMHPTFP